MFCFGLCFFCSLTLHVRQSNLFRYLARLSLLVGALVQNSHWNWAVCASCGHSVVCVHCSRALLCHFAVVRCLLTSFLCFVLLTRSFCQAPNLWFRASRFVELFERKAWLKIGFTRRHDRFDWATDLSCSPTVSNGTVEIGWTIFLLGRDLDVDL